jgi:hypothetical protein
MSKRFIIAAILALLLPVLSFAAEPPHTFGMVFEMRNLLLTIDPYTDGYQAGAGVKWWPGKSFALRGLVGMDFNTLDGVTTMDAGVSAAAEYHLITGKISPYIGALVGLRVAIAAENALDVYAGAMGGAEMNVWENIGVFAEYELLMSIDANGFTIALGTGGVQIGLIVYLK